jgi:hypothetical protein
MTHFSMGLLENFCAENNKLRQKYTIARGSYLEQEVKNLSKKLFHKLKYLRAVSG